MISRLITIDDWENYYRLRLTSLRVAPEAFGSTYEQEENCTKKDIVNKIEPTINKFFMGLFDEGHLVGVISFQRSNGRKMEHKGEIYNFFVLPEYQNRGWGKQLLSDLIKKIKEDYKSIENINLSVVSNNKQAINLYKSLGFKKYGFEIKALKEGNSYFDEDLMVLMI